MMTNFLQRTLTGILFVLVVIGSILVHAYAFFAVTVLISVIAINEFTQLLAKKYGKINQVMAIVIGVSIQLIAFLVANGFVRQQYFLLILPLIWIPFVVELFEGGEHPFRRIALTLLGPIYTAVPLALLYHLGFVFGTYEPLTIIGFFVLVWSNDTGAYLVGVSMGKHKLYERISPKKTWEGFIGGILFTFVAAFFIHQYTGLGSLALWMVAGLIVGLFGTTGDLIESMLKRNVDIKDSGNILPGHGGVLDRFDAVLFAAPLIFTLFILFS